MIKKFIKVLLILGFFLLLVSPVRAQTENQVTIYFFWSKNCPHCTKEKVFLEKLSQQYSVEVKSLEISNHENAKLLQKAGEKLKADTGYIPFTIIGSRYFVGYLDDQTTGQEIETSLKEALQSGCVDIFQDSFTSSQPCPEETKTPSQTKSIPETINLPLLGEIKTRTISLPLLTLVMGVLDGFNPCAMWTLLFLISLLLGMKDKKRMWILGTAFIVASAFVYFLFLTAWLNFFLFIGFIFWVRIIISLVALGAGSYSLRDYFVNKEAGCEVVGDKKRQRIFEKIKKVTQKKEFLFALGGIILLALAVNLVEFICSAGLPAIYTQILSLSKLPSWQYYLYLLGYIFFFMIDDLFIFFTAMITLKAVGIENKYARFSRLFGGLLMLVIGLLLLLKPEWLIFG